MTRIVGITAACACILSSCTPLPAHADVIHDQLPADPARPGWRAPAPRTNQPAAGVAYDFDPAAGPLSDPHAADNIWLVTPGAWGAGEAPVQVSPGPVVRPCVPIPAPGPLPVLGAAAAWGWARRLRRRVRP